MAEYTIDQLVQESGVPSSTIRMYGNRRLLPAPARRGRIGVYDETHLERLKLIERLKAAGYSLAAIGDLVDAHKRGDALSAVLGVPTSANEPLRLTSEELAERFPIGSLTQDSLMKALSLGLIRFDENAVVLDHPQFVEIGAQLSALGLTADSYIDEYETLKAHTDAIAQSFTALFERERWQPSVDSNALSDELPSLIEALQKIGPLAETIVREAFRLSLRNAAETFVQRHEQELAAAGYDIDVDSVFE